MSPKNPWEMPPEDNDPWKRADSSFSFDLNKIKKQFRWGSGGGNSGGRDGFSLGYLYAMAGIFTLFYLSSGFYQVQHDERGVVLRFGRWVRTVGPGLQYILPYPFERVLLQRVTTVNQIDIGSFSKNNQQDEK